MPVVRYTGVTYPADAFGELLPLRQRLLAMQDQVRPLGSDYLTRRCVAKIAFRLRCRLSPASPPMQTVYAARLSSIPGV